MMPAKGWVNFTIKEDAAQVLIDYAEKRKETVSSLLVHIANDIESLDLVLAIKKETILEALGQAHIALECFQKYYDVLKDKEEKKPFFGQLPKYVTRDFILAFIEVSIHDPEKRLEKTLEFHKMWKKFLDLLLQARAESTKLDRILGTVNSPRTGFQIYPLIFEPDNTPASTSPGEIRTKATLENARNDYLTIFIGLKEDVANFINNSEEYFGAYYCNFHKSIELLDRIKPICGDVVETISVLEDIYNFLCELKQWLIITLEIEPRYIINKESDSGS